MEFIAFIAGLSGVISTLGTIAIIVSLYASFKNDFRLALKASWVLLVVAPFMVLIELLIMLFARGAGLNAFLGAIIWGFIGAMSYRTVKQSGWSWARFRSKFARKKAPGREAWRDNVRKPPNDYWRKN